MRITYIMAASALGGLCITVQAMKLQDRGARIEALEARLSALSELVLHERQCCLAAHPYASATASDRERRAEPPEAVAVSRGDRTLAAPTDALAGAEATQDELDEPESELELQFEREEADSRWARGAEHAIEDKLVRQASHLETVSSVECRASMCRIETIHKTPADILPFFGTTFADPTTRIWETQTVLQSRADDESDETVVVSYVTREGPAVSGTPAEGHAGLRGF